MRKLPVIALAGSAVIIISGTPAAATSHSHMMNFPLPDGSVARVEYVGNVAPRITIEPAVSQDDQAWVSLPSIAGFEGMIARMNQQTEAMIRQAQKMADQPLPKTATPYVASLRNAPQGASSMTILSYSNGSGTCTRTTQAVSEGPGKPVKVTSNISGSCSNADTIGPSSISPPTSHT